MPKFLTKFLAGRLGSWAFLGLLALAIGATVYGGIQSSRADTAETLAASRQQTITGLEQRVTADAGLIKQRDELIAQQNAGIAAISAQRQQTREIYIRQFAAADQAATSQDQRAREIMSLPNQQLDELASCRASRILLQDELVRR